MRCPIWCDEGGVQLPPGAAPLPNSQRCQCSIFVKLYMYRQQRQSVVPVRLGKKGSKYIAFAAASGVQPVRAHILYALAWSGFTLARPVGWMGGWGALP